MRSQFIRHNRMACSLLALATALAVGPSPAAAQVAGNGTFAVGSGTITPGTGTVTVDTSRAVINWNSTGTVVAGVNEFLAPTNTLTFNGTGNFAVLNRVSTGTDMLGLNGTVNAGQGSIYFYNPNGVVVGGNAAFNVGSLVLTTLNITDSNFASGSTTINFAQASNPLSSVAVSSGAQINALQTDSYVAMVAPRVVHNGTITTNGQAALVGAEAATITFSPDGLFDITVDAGTTDANGVVIGGSIGGQQSSGIGDNNRIYAVAVPKNQAMTLAITAGANLGFNVAGRADVVGNAIVLSAGHNIVDGEVAATPAPAGGIGEASISAQNFTATSALTGVAKTNAEIIATSARTLHSDVTLKATGEARIVSSTVAGNLTIRGDVQISADRLVAAGATGTAGAAALYADSGGTLTAEQNVTLTADAAGEGSETAGVNGGNATGGTVSLLGQFGGQIFVWSNVSLSAEGFGGDAIAAGVNAGTGSGGTIQAQTFGVGSLLDVGGNVSATADGWGGFANCGSCNGFGGVGNGGFIYVGAANDADGSTATFGNFESFVSLAAQGFGGGARGGTASATGTGGTIFVWSQGNDSDVTLQGNLYAYADGFGGEAYGAGVNGGLGDGGNIFVLAGLENASLTVTGLSTLTADGYGGNSGGEGCFSCDASGGTGIGGEVQLATSSSSPGASLSFGGLVAATTNAYGGSGIAGGGDAIGGGATGSGSAGVVATFAADTSIAFNNGFNLSATAEGGDATDGNGGNALGGRARSGSQTGAIGGSLTVIGAATMVVQGLGGDAAAGGMGGTGRGGRSDNGGNAGALAYQAVNILTQGTGGNSTLGAGGAGFGGSGWLEAFGAVINASGTVSVDSSAQGGNGATSGGSGTGGFALVGTTNNGSLAIGGSANVFARGTGGTGGTGTGGFGGGGDAIIRAIGGNVTIAGSALASTDGTGGAGTVGGVGDGDADPSNGVGGARLRAGNGSQLTIGGTASMLSRGFGGSGTTFGGAAFGGFSQILAFADADVVVGGLSRIDTDAFASGGADGFGGYSQVFAGSGATIGLDRLNLRADGHGGDDAGQEAGDGYGGTAEFTATGLGSSVTVTNNITSGLLQDREMLSADGFGGITNGNVEPEGGDGSGGTVNLSALAGASVNLATNATGTNNILIRARGYGGAANANDTIAGEAFGGTLNLLVDGATMTTGHLQFSAIGQGGSAMGTATNVTGGAGFGGTRNISVLNSATLTTAIVGGIAGGVGGDGNGTGNGGNASGGTANLTVNNSTLNGIGNIGITTQVFAGSAAGTGSGGSASGPNSVNVNIANSTINMAPGSTLGFFATSFGGMSQSGIGGSAAGGTLNASISGSTITGGTLIASAVGSGGDGLTGGGNASGGTANFNVASSTVNVQALRIDASAGGGYSASGMAGSGTAGTASLVAGGGATNITLSAAPLEILAAGYGGYITGSGGAAASGNGGFAQIFVASGNSLTVNAATNIDARGFGGNSAGSGSGGVGDGGTAAIYTNGGTINLNGNATLLANANGGNATAGTGGNSQGGSARVGTDAGLVSISGALTLDGSAAGGNGLAGGNAVALVSLPDETGPVAAAIYAGNGGGVITVAGATAINASATGGNGSGGNGGNASAGETDIVAFIGDITLVGLTVNGNGTGGAGGVGGAGGFGTGGQVDVAFGLAAAPVDGLITIATADIDANGAGGAGGEGAAGNSGGNGGAGGAGTGGQIFFIGSAAGGSLQSGNVTLNARGSGGAGGAGGNGDSGTGGNGGAGGTATGGYVLAGTLSNSGSPGNGGDFDVANISIDSSAIGGSGGNGGTGGGGSGTGGNGGNASGGGANLLIRGVAATADAVTLFANATGGNGGIGSTTGNGGNAKTGLIFAEAKDRFGVPAQRGSLTADSINATAIATGGSGGFTGTETVMGGSYFRVLNGDATIGSVNFTISGDLYDDTFYSDFVSVRDGSANIGSFSYSTTGALSLDASNGSMGATTIALTAGNFRANRADVPAPTSVGTYSANSFAISTGGDFITNANLVSQNALSIVAPGLIQMAGVTGQSSVTLDANGGPITAGNIVAAGLVDLDAPGAISVGNVSGSSLDVDTGATFQAGTLATTNGDMFVDAAGNVTLGNVNPIGGDLTLNSGGNVVLGTLGTITGNASFLQSIITAAGSVTGVAINAQDNVRVFAGTGVTFGNITASSANLNSTAGNISVGEVSNGGLFYATAAGGSIIAGNILSSFGQVRLLADDNITAGNVTSGRQDMIINGGGTVTTGNLVIQPGTGTSVVGITVNGANITTGSATSPGSVTMTSTGTLATATINAATFANLTGAGNVAVSGAITAADIDVNSAGGALSLGNLTSQGAIDLNAAGNLLFGNVSATDFNFEVGGAVQGGNIVATNHADGEAEGAIVLGDITVSGPPTDGDFSVGLVSATSIQVGNITAFDKAGFATFGNLTTGNISAGSLIMALASGDIVTGALTTAGNGQVYIADSSMFETGGGIEDFDASIVLALNPVATGGSMMINGAVDTPLFRAAIGEAFGAGDISVEGGFVLQASSISTGDISATVFIDLLASGAIITGDLFAGTSVTLSGESVSTGDIAAGLGAPVSNQGFAIMNVGPGNAVEIFSDSSIATGNITTDGYVGLYAVDDITAGSITAEHDVIALAGGDASFGAITTPERFILAGYGNFGQINDGQTFDPALIFGLFPIESTGGNATFAGSSSALQFEAYVGGNTDMQSITVNPDLGEAPVLGTGGYIRIDTGGTLAIAGQVSGDYIDFVSRDINIGSQAQIVAGQGITFSSINPDGTYIGDNLTGTSGYRLSQAELDRVDSPFYGFDVLALRGAAPMMMIGDLTLDLSGGEDDEGADFEIDDAEGQDGDDLVGIIRIVGDVALTSSTDKTVYLTAETVAIDAATGSLSLADGSGALNGLIEFEANNIFVASGAIIDKLLVDPRYSGHVAELNAPAAVQRPEGVLRAGAIDFDDEAALQNLLVQNTGTAAAPAGFVVLSESTYYDGIEDGDNEDLPAPGSINLVINGQIVTPTGTVTGAAVRDALVVEYGSAEPFTANSTINGCPLTGGSCGGEVFPPTAVVTPTQVAILTSDPLGESFFGNEEEIGDNSTDDESSNSPISAPQPLFDTRPMNSDEEVNEPVSGAGNPTLYEISSDEDDEDEDEDEEKNKKKGEAKPAAQVNVRSGDGK